MNDAVMDAWTVLRDSLLRRSLALHEEVRAYPTPIARCDEQLTKLIEDRDDAFRRLRVAGALDGMRPAGDDDAWHTRVVEFVAGLGAVDDVAVADARRRLIAALGR